MRHALLALPLALTVVAACGQETGDSSAPPVVSATRQPVVGGIVDNTTNGVVGLAVSGPGRPVIGHCSGTLIAPNLVLTARHCVSLTSGTPDEQVQCGVSRFSTTAPGDIFLASPDTVRPTTASAPTFFRSVAIDVPKNATDFCGFDVALVTLGDSIPAGLATPIEPRLDSTPSAREKFSAEGFGLTEPDASDGSGTRMRLDTRTVSCAGAECGDATHVQADEWLSLDAKICPGDSGGPALDSSGRVMGVASRGAEGCRTAIYGDVYSWRDLIEQAARAAAERGGYEVPAWATVADDAGTAATPPLGLPCEGRCAGGYVCYAETGNPPGICVPRCADSNPDCPSGYSCSSSLSACVPASSQDSGGGCQVTAMGGNADMASAIIVGLGIASVAARRLRPKRVLTEGVPARGRRAASTFR